MHDWVRAVQMPRVPRLPSLAARLFGMTAWLLAAAACDPGPPPRPATPWPTRLETSRENLDRASIGDESRYVLHQEPASFELEIPPVAVLDVGFGVTQQGWDRGLREVAFSVTFESEGRRSSLLNARETPPKEGAPRRWRDVTLDLGDLAGRTGVLRFAVRSTGGDPLAAGDAVWSSPGLSSAESEPGINFILISIDTLRADRLHSYGNPRETSPNIDRIAREGVLFRQAVSASNWTLPSHVSMLTGLNPSVHGAASVDLTTPMSDGVELLAERLWDAGFDTAGITDGGFVSIEQGFDRGFDRFFAWPTQEGIGGRLQANSSIATRWIRERRGRQFFLFLHTYQVHMPYTAPHPFDQLFDGDYEGPFARDFQVQDYLPFFDRDDLAPAVVRHLQALYDGEIRYTDELIGALPDFLTEEGLADRTCVLLTSDHGEEFQEHGNLFHHHMKLYDELIRVPLVVWCPGLFPGGRIVEEPVSIVDIPPTVLEIAGAAPLEGIQGVSLLPALRGESLPGDRMTVSEVGGSIEQFQRLFRDSSKDAALDDEGSSESAPESFRGPDPERAFVLALRTDRYKLVYSHESETRSLYDLQRDPHELHDISAERPDVVARFESAIQEILRARAAAGTGRSPGRVDEAAIERLRSLGYLR